MLVEPVQLLEASSVTVVSHPVEPLAGLVGFDDIASVNAPVADSLPPMSVLLNVPVIFIEPLAWVWFPAVDVVAEWV